MLYVTFWDGSTMHYIPLTAKKAYKRILAGHVDWSVAGEKHRRFGNGGMSVASCSPGLIFEMLQWVITAPLPRYYNPAKDGGFAYPPVINGESK